MTVDLDQPNGEILHDHEIGPVKFETVLSTIHRFLAGQQRTDQALLHSRIDQLVPRFIVSLGPVTYTSIDRVDIPDEIRP